MDTVDRIFELFAQKFKNDKEFALAIGVRPQRISEWRQRISKSYQKCLPQIADVLGTTTEYLLTGTVPEVAGANALSEDDAEILRQIHDRPGMRVMFSLTSKASDDDIKKATEIIRAFLGVPEGES